MRGTTRLWRVVITVGLLVVGTSCRPRTKAMPVDAGPSMAASSAVPAKARTPVQPAPPMASRNSEVAKALEDLKADKAYAAIWEPARKADLSFFLTCVSDALSTTDDKGIQTLPVGMMEALKQKKLSDAAMTVLFVDMATGSFPEEFATKARQYMASGAAAPHRGLWSEYKKGRPQHDFSTLAAHLEPENAEYLREMIAARARKVGGPFGWELTGPALRPWLSRERAALATLALLGPLTEPEQARLAQLIESPLGDDPGLQVDLADVLSEYKNNEVRADGKLKGKVIHVSGSAQDIKKNAFDHIYIVIRTGAAWEHPDLHCLVAKSQQSKASEVDKGDTIVVRGRVNGMVLTSVMLQDCEIDD